MTSPAKPTVARLEQSEPISFGPLSHYQKLIGEAPLPLFTGVQTCKPGYRTPDHFHPYAEYLFVIEGVMEAWLVGREDDVQRIGAGDIIALPPDTPHAFRNPGPGELRLLGIHANPDRIVHRLDAVAQTY
jgi:quercetin dioxygenase-like cupin family protein